MAIIEIETLSGCTFDHDAVKDLIAENDLKIKKTELKDGDTKLAVYLDSIGRDKICIEMRVNILYKVQEQKKACIEVYDYYDNSKFSVSFLMKKN